MDNGKWIIKLCLNLLPLNILKASFRLYSLNRRFDN